MDIQDDSCRDVLTQLSHINESINDLREKQNNLLGEFEKGQLENYALIFVMLGAATVSIGVAIENAIGLLVAGWVLMLVGSFFLVVPGLFRKSRSKRNK